MSAQLQPSQRQTTSPQTADWRDAPTRAERGQRIRQALFNAAAQVVGEVGYQGASITLITQRAGVAQGTFYNHFESRQDILDQLLPTLGLEMLKHVHDRARHGKTLLEQEELGFRAFFSFLREREFFFRILNEAESFAPKGHRAHLEQVAHGYVRFLARARERGQLPAFEERELEAIAFVLMAARSYLAWRYFYGQERQDEVPDWVVNTYMKMVSNGLKLP